MSLESILKDMRKKGINISEEKDSLFEIKRQRFPSMTLNYMTYGGLPKGKMVSIAGTEGSGKTTLTYAIAGQMQRDGEDDRKVVILDTEGAFDYEWAEKQGMNTEEILLIAQQEESAELLLDSIINLVETGEVGIIIIDSLDGLVPQAVIERNIEKDTIASLPKVYNKFLKKINGLLMKHHTTLLVVNQIRQDVGSMWGGLVINGGKAFKHYQSLILFLTGGQYFDENFKDVTQGFGTPRGKRVNVSIRKMRYAPSNRKTGTYTIDFVSGVDKEADLIAIAEMYGYVERKGAWYSIYDSETGEEIEKVQGMGNVRKKLQEDTELFDKLYQATYEKCLEIEGY